MDPTKAELYTAKRTSGVDLSSPNIGEVWGSVRSDDNPKNWILLGYADRNCIDVVNSGENGLDELLDHLVDDKVFYGGVRVNDDAGKIKFSISYAISG